eukprot:TRINITY_DN24757_c0_g2_i1.p1 TRINITY_DN24757_c0_g2~~TRINITY_DN24757_c0_g2_i1.p1  ORF type:complete len:181 (+),score=14.60 TRINITY_DN24757_c0_g2_i1:49-591(+)
MDFLKAYDLALQRRPVPTKVVTAALTGALSDFLSQQLAGVSGGGVAILRSSLIGSAITVVVHKWYQLLDRIFAAWPPQESRTVMAKTILQMIIMEPLLATLYMSSQNLLRGESFSSTVQHLRTSLLGVTIGAWSVWGPTAVINYRWVPTRYMNLTSNVVNLLFTIWLIGKTSKQKKPQKQ